MAVLTKIHDIGPPGTGMALLQIKGDNPYVVNGLDVSDAASQAALGPKGIVIFAGSRGAGIGEYDYANKKVRFHLSTTGAEYTAVDVSAITLYFLTA